MSIVIDLDPEVEAAIQESAASVSMDTQRYVSRWIGLLAGNPEIGKALGELHDQGKRDAIFARAIQIETMRRDIEEFGTRHKLPDLSDEALTRESIYQDHP